MNTLIVKKENSILEIKLNRPDVHNAFNTEMISDLTKAFLEPSQDKSIRLVKFSGEGKSFCAGADLQWMKSMVKFSFEENVTDSEQLYKMFETVANCPVPVVTKVHGNVMGGGIGLVAVSDIVIAEKETKFCFSEVKLGLVPSVISSFVLPKMSPSSARELMLTAEVFNAQRALQADLVHFVGEGEEAEDYFQSRVDFLMKNGPEALRSLKHILRFYETHNQHEVKSETIRVIAERRVSQEGQEGLKSFFEKRSPSWRK